MDITRTYLSDLPQSIGIAIISSDIVLFFIGNMDKWIIIGLFLWGFLLIKYSMSWDLDMLKEQDIKGMKKTLRDMKKEIKKNKKTLPYPTLPYHAIPYQTL